MVFYSIEAAVANYEKLVDENEKSISASVFQVKTDQALRPQGKSRASETAGMSAAWSKKRP